MELQFQNRAGGLALSSSSNWLIGEHGVTLTPWAYVTGSASSGIRSARVTASIYAGTPWTRTPSS